MNNSIIHRPFVSAFSAAMLLSRAAGDVHAQALVAKDGTYAVPLGHVLQCG